MESENEKHPLNMIQIKKITEETIKIFNSTFFYNRNIKITPKSITINKYQINYQKYNKKYIILIGKGIYGLLNYLSRNETIKENFIINALVPDKKKIETMTNWDNIKILEGNHPIPKENSFESTKYIITTMGNLDENDLLIFFISGGSSSLFCYHNTLLSSNEFSEIWEKLLFSNLFIHEINFIRGKIDLVKKGGAISFTKSKIISFYLSDVVGDNLSTIGSGPTIVSHETINERSILENLPKSISKLLEKIKNQVFEGMTTKNLITNNLFISQLDYAKEFSKIVEKYDYKCILHLPAFIGNYKEVSYNIINFFKKDTEFKDYSKNSLNIWTGESIVEVPERKLNAVGGRNQHLLLFLFKLWIENELPSALLVTFATDGMDGNSSYAGGWINTQKSNRDLNVIENHLKDFNSSSYLKPDNVIETGVTGVNFADMIIIHIF